MKATDAILDFTTAAGSASLPIPATVCDDAIRLLGDTLAVGAAGAAAPGADQILEVARRSGSGDEARLLGSDERLPAPSAAFVNGYRIHCLEWDAVHEPAVVHALSVVTAALGAVIDRRGGCSPDEAIAALIVGVDVASGLGFAADSPLTFFRPATAGLLGAALAVARIEGAPTADALNLAYSMCAGTMQAHVEGSLALPFQIANAARAAVVAADLAKAGFGGPRGAIEGQFGYFALFDQGDPGRYAAELGRVWRISDVSTKPYPSGRASHATLSILEALELDSAQVERVEALVPPLVARLVGRPMKADMSPAYARLCLPFLTALMLSERRIDPRRFTGEAFADPDLLNLANRVIVQVDRNEDVNALSPQLVRLTKTGGEVIERTIPDTLGSSQAPLSAGGAEAKRALARELAPSGCDPRLFDDPLSYFTEPR